MPAGTVVDKTGIERLRVGDEVVVLALRGANLQSWAVSLVRAGWLTLGAPGGDGMAAARMLVVSTALWCMTALSTGQAPVTKDAQARMEKVISCLPSPVAVADDPASACVSLAERMAAFHVPGVSIAVVYNGGID